MTPGLPIWVVYDHPSDYPNNYVARLWVGEEATDSIIICPDLDTLRAMLGVEMGLTCLTRSEGDDPKIVETWL